MQCFAGSEKWSGAAPNLNHGPQHPPPVPQFPSHSEQMRAARDSITIRQHETAQYNSNLLLVYDTVSMIPIPMSDIGDADTDTACR